MNNTMDATNSVVVALSCNKNITTDATNSVLVAPSCNKNNTTGATSNKNTISGIRRVIHVAKMEQQEHY
jgi:hypothetical protein